MCLDERSLSKMSVWNVVVNVTAAAPSLGNNNNTTWLATLEEPVGNWMLLLLSPVCLFGIGGNILAIMAISLERRLQNVTNYFLLSLAVTDLLVSLIVMPLSIINGVTGEKCQSVNGRFCCVNCITDTQMNGWMVRQIGGQTDYFLFINFITDREEGRKYLF